MSPAPAPPPAAASDVDAGASAASEAPPTDRPATLAHRLEYAALRTALGGLGALSWDRATAVGAWLGRTGYAPLGIRRGVVERQIAAAFPEFDADRVRAVARASYESLGRTTLEAALVPRLGRQGVLDLFERVEGWDVLEAALARGRGALVVTGHLGNWELGGSYVAARGVPIDGVARQMANPLFDGFLTDTRQRLGMTVVWDGHAVRRTPRALRENRVVAMVSDQGALGLASTWVPFFGRPAKTPRGPAVFALRLKVPILFAAAVRQPSGRFLLGFEPVPVEETGDRERDVDTIVAAYTRQLEAWVRRYPEQYFWQHRRWKHQPADTPAHLREP
ncbi:lysophospholipid acyltransferase family protein [Roseisolibacter sp. H3M3-2]|uniref:lysophospholipid acyltransferase family protein n=1 Tax=Roseisolibacter sp. H3M3-2 TaxID=3031323 RepID=UPI0023D99EF6|nr:lysophospholipid acyltransferase family protein [Roseisolibacter sp. H3M3-2]MDF1503083.1 lysophospholipid acyltransferase family protein [Roseisolibacter sp. H3M3-2]